MAIVHSTRCYAVDEHGVGLDRQAAALAYAELSRDDVRHQLDEGSNLRFVDDAALVDELAQAHGRIAELEAAQVPARAAQPPSQLAQRPAASPIDDAAYAAFASHFAIFPCPSLNGAL